MIRACVKDAVDLCLYVAASDASGEADATLRLESFRKMRWRKQKEAVTIGESVETALEAKSLPISRPIDCDYLPPVHDIVVASESIDQENEPEAEAPFEFHLDRYLNEFIAPSVNLRDIRALPVGGSTGHPVMSRPSRREGHSMTLCSLGGSTVLLVFGGRMLRDLTNLLPVATTIDPLKLERVRYTFSNAVYSYDLQTSAWSLRDCHGKTPRERSDHSAVFVAPHFVVIFGGRGKSGQIYDDCFALSLKTWEWVELDTRTRPSPRYWHGCCVIAESMFVFGGKSESLVYTDLQQLNISRAISALLTREMKVSEDSPARAAPRPTIMRLPLSWVSPHTVGTPPSARFGVRMVQIDQDRMAVIGGWRISRTQKKKNLSTTVHFLDTTSMVWTKPQPSSHICAHLAPPERFSFECFYAFGTIVVFGGFTFATDGTTERYAAREDDRQVVYKLDLRRMIWHQEVVACDDALIITTNCPSFASSAFMRQGDTERVGYVCVARETEQHIQLGAVTLKQAE